MADFSGKRFMVAVDGSTSALSAFYGAMSVMNKDEDELYIISALLRPTPTYASYGGGVVIDVTEEQVAAVKRLLAAYCQKAKANGVQRIFPMLGSTYNVGELIIASVEDKKIDILVVGRRGMSGVARVVLGSTSKYLLEHCPCDVLVIKGEWGPTEEHVDVAVVRSAEAEEQARRVAEEAEYEAQVKAESAAARAEAVRLEEEERERRVREDQARVHDEAVASGRNKIITQRDEEIERRRRMAEDVPHDLPWLSEITTLSYATHRDGSMAPIDENQTVWWVCDVPTRATIPLTSLQISRR